MKKSTPKEKKPKESVRAFIVREPDFKKREGLVPVIVQEKDTGLVLMHVYTRREEFLETLETGEAVFYSTSRKKRWKKGEEVSRNILIVEKMMLDCDGDALLYLVTQTRTSVGACHTGKETCFFRPVVGSALEWERDVVETLSVCNRFVV